MIFLKPTIVRGTQGGREITSERYDYLRGEQLQNMPEVLDTQTFLVFEDVEVR